MRNGKNTSMKQWIKDTAGLGTALWLMGYLASLVLFFSPYAGIMGWILLVIFTPVTLVIVWWWFSQPGAAPPAVLREGGCCLGADCHRARLPVHRAYVPGSLLRHRCVPVLYR